MGTGAGGDPAAGAGTAPQGDGGVATGAASGAGACTGLGADEGAEAGAETGVEIGEPQGDGGVFAAAGTANTGVCMAPG